MSEYDRVQRSFGAGGNVMVGKHGLRKWVGLKGQIGVLMSSLSGP